MFRIPDSFKSNMSAIASGGAEYQKLCEFTRSSDELITTYTSYCLMTSHGDIGFKDIVEIAIEGRKLKHRSAALTMLSILSKTGQLSENAPWPIDSEILTTVNSFMNVDETKLRASVALNKLISSLPDDDVLLAVSMSFMQLDMSRNHDLSGALIRGLSNRWLKFGAYELAEYKDLIEKHPNDEKVFQKFFIKYPQFLDPYAIQVWSQPDLLGVFEPDFLIRRADNTYVIVEIEKPSKMLITKNKTLSAEAIHAEQQTTDYDEYLTGRLTEARHHFQFYSGADCLTVIGLEDTLNAAQKQTLRMINKNRRGNNQIIGFDRLYHKAKTILQNVEVGEIKVIEKYRMGIPNNG